jgi:hypothetical protein
VAVSRAGVAEHRARAAAMRTLIALWLLLFALLCAVLVVVAFVH